MKLWALMLIGMTMASAPALVSAQVSLATVVDLARRWRSLKMLLCPV